MLHRQICTFACSDVLSPQVIASNLHCAVETVYRVLAHPPIRDEIERRKSMQLYDRLDTIADMSEIQHEAAKRLKDKLFAGELSDSMTLKVFEIMSDRHPDRALLKQTKQINEGSQGKARGTQLVELRSRAEALMPANVAKFEAKTKQAEAADG